MKIIPLNLLNISKAGSSFKEEARLKDGDLEGLLSSNRKTYIAINRGWVIGIVSVRQGSDGRAWIDRFYFKNIKEHLKDAYKLLLMGISSYKRDYFYLEVEEDNPHADDLFYENCEYITSSKNKKIYKRRFDV